jgi:hypothetical protein
MSASHFSRRRIVVSLMTSSEVIRRATQSARLRDQSVERFDRVVIGAFLAKLGDLYGKLP